MTALIMVLVIVGLVVVGGPLLGILGLLAMVGYYGHKRYESRKGRESK